MEDNDIIKFRVAPLTTDNDYTWSNDLKLISEKELWKLVRNLAEDRSESLNTTVDGADVRKGTEVDMNKQNDVRIQSRDLAPACIFTSIYTTCEALVRKVRFPSEAWRMLKEKQFQAYVKM